MSSPIFYSHRGNPRITDLLMSGGQAQAEHARRQAELFAGALGGIGQAVAGGIQEHQERKRQSKNERALRDAIYSWDDADPKGSAMRLFQVAGPKGLEYAKTFASLKENVQSKDPKTNLQGAKAAVTFFNEDTPEGKSRGYQRLLQTLAPTGSYLGIDPAQVPPEYGPEAQSFLDRFVKGTDSFLGTKPEKVDVPKPGSFEAFAAARGVDTPESMLAARTDWESAGRAPVVPPKPDKTLQEIEAEAAARARGTASVKTPEQTKEFALNPEGVVLSGYGTKEKSIVRAQAMQSGLPVFENTSTQVKGLALRGIYEDAAELDRLLKIPEVKAAVGAASGRWGQFKANFVDLPPDVQAAFQIMGSLSDSELRKRSGASAGDPEMQRIFKFSTDPNKPLGHNLTAISRMLQTSDRDFKALSGVGLSKKAADASGTVQPKSKAEYDALPSGTMYIDKDGTRKVKK